MDATTIIAIIGAATGTASLLIQGASWWAGRTRLKLSVNPGTAPVVMHDDGGGGQVMEDGAVVFVQITNKSPHPVKIGKVGAVDPDTGHGYFAPASCQVSDGMAARCLARRGELGLRVAPLKPTGERVDDEQADD